MENWCSQNSTNQLKSNVELGCMCPLGNSVPPTVTLTKWLKWCMHARYMKVLSVTVSMFKRRMVKKLGHVGERREKWGTMHRLVLSFLDCFTVTLGGLMLLYYMEEGRGLAVFPRINFGRIYAELWYSGPTWTKNSAYRTVTFLDFWVREWYQNYNQLFRKLMKGIACWIVGCIPPECFELTQKLFKWGEIIRTLEFVDFFVTRILIGGRSESENFVENEHFMCQFPW